MRAAILILIAALTPAAQSQPLAKLLEEHKVPAAGIGIIRNGQLREVKVVGELRKGEPAPHDAIFNVASLTKPVVSMLTLRLVSAGEWQVDEPLAAYWVDPDVLIHTGSDEGVHALVMLLPKSGQGLVVMTNGDNGFRLYERLVTDSLDLGKDIMDRAK